MWSDGPEYVKLGLSAKSGQVWPLLSPPICSTVVLLILVHPPPCISGLIEGKFRKAQNPYTSFPPIKDSREALSQLWNGVQGRGDRSSELW